MNSPNPPTQYLLFFRGPEWDRGMSPVEIQEVLDRATEWSENLGRQGKIKGGQALKRSGCIVTDRHAEMITDGPFAESKEAIGGYLLLEADTLEEAIDVAKGAPMLKHGITVEIRPTLNECPIVTRLREQLVEVVA